MIEGRYFEPQHSRAAPARLQLEGLELVVVAQDGTRLSKIVARVSDPLSGTPRKIHFADGSLFEAPPDAPLALLGLSEGFMGRVSRLERSLKGVALAASLTIAAIAGFWIWGLPALAQVAALATPDSVLAAMDKGVFDAMERSLLEPSTLTPERKAEIGRLFGRLAARAGVDAQLYFRKAPRIGANAFALPGGSIVLTDGLVELSQSNSEIAGILAHELGHIEKRHTLRALYSAAGVGVAVMLIGGDPGHVVDSVVSQAGVLQSLAYSRDFEREADLRSVELVQAIGEDPEAFLALLDRAAGPDGEGSILTTHPGTRERRDIVRRAARGASR